MLVRRLGVSAESVRMGKLFSVVGPIVGLAFVGLAASPRFIEYGWSRATLLALAGGIFTIALAVHIKD